MNNIEYLYTIYNNVLDMLRDRQYKVPKSVSLSFKDFKKKYVANNYNITLTHTHTRRKIYVLFSYLLSFINKQDCRALSPTCSLSPTCPLSQHVRCRQHVRWRQGRYIYLHRALGLTEHGPFSALRDGDNEHGGDNEHVGDSEHVGDIE